MIQELRIKSLTMLLVLGVCVLALVLSVASTRHSRVAAAVPAAATGSSTGTPWG
jgi:hypothetical protein